MAITGISSIDNKQIIAAGALSAISANQALVTSGGDSLQGLYDTVSTNSGSWTGGGSYPRDITADSILLSAELNPGDSDLASVNISPTGINFVHPVQGYSDVNVAAIQNWDSTYETVSTNSASWTGGGGGSVPDEVMSAASAVSANSANWNEATDTLSANSADWSAAAYRVSSRSAAWNSNYTTVNNNSGSWGGSALPISAGPGISLSIVDNVLVISTAGV